MMILKQFYLNCLAHASYLIGDERAQWAAVVDPQRDVDQYLTFAADHHVRIAHVFLTHFHADFIAGHIELRDRTGALVLAIRRPGGDFVTNPSPEDVIEAGDVLISVGTAEQLAALAEFATQS